jgi:RsiW-degrading membrane proteinase PrsW (M82 family)
MIDSAVSFFVSFFRDPTAWGIGLAVGFGVVWLVFYRPPFFRKPWLWAVLAGSAFFTLVAICFIQFPLQTWTGQALIDFLRPEAYVRWMLLASIPQMLIMGLVQEGAKMVPMVVYWWRSDRDIDPKMGLAIGAVAGAGFAIFEAQWQYNALFTSGWTWASLQAGGFMDLLGFWGVFFTMAGHIAFSALCGYGLARGRGWQFYLIISGLHALLKYSTVLLGAGTISAPHAEIYTAAGIAEVAVVAVAVTAWALWLRWRKGEGKT